MKHAKIILFSAPIIALILGYGLFTIIGLQQYALTIASCMGILAYLYTACKMMQN